MSSGAEESDSGLEGYSDSEVDEAVNLGGAEVAVVAAGGPAEQDLGAEEGDEGDGETSEVRGELRRRLGLDGLGPILGLWSRLFGTIRSNARFPMASVIDKTPEMYAGMPRRRN